MEKALKDTDEAIEEASKKTEKSGSKFSQFKDKLSNIFGESKGLGTVINDLGGKFGVSLPEGVTKGLDSIAKVNPAMLAAAGGITALVTAIVKVEQALMKMTDEAADYADDVLMFAEQTSMSTDAVQAWSYASERLDVSFDTVKGSLKDLTSNMKSYRDAMDEGEVNDQVKAFQALGITVYDANGEFRNANDVFYETIDALGQVQNSTERDALAMSVLGESAQELNPFIKEGSASLREYAAEAANTGYIMSTETLESLQAVDDAQQELLATQKKVSNQIAGEYAPYMTEALGNTKDFIDKIGTSLTKSKIVESFGSILTSASGLLEPIGTLAGYLMPALAKAMEGVAYTFALIADTANVVAGILTFDWNKISTGLGLNVSSGQLSNTQKLYYKDALEYTTYDPTTGTWVGNAYNGYVQAGSGFVPYNAVGTDNFPGGVTWVGENGPEQVYLPRGTQILNAQESRLTGGDVFYITIEARTIQEFMDIVRMAQAQRRLQRMEG